MTTVCPKCRHVRPADTTAPEWQCSSCGVAYAKVSAGAVAAQLDRRGPLGGLQTIAASSRWGWRPAFLGVAVVCLLWFAQRIGEDHRGRDSALLSLGGSLGTGASEAYLHALASATRPGDVTMYTTTGCPYCAQARSWMTQHGFTFNECDAAMRQVCADEMKARHVKGVPFLLVKGRPMNDGFDADQFVSLLSRR